MRLKREHRCYLHRPENQRGYPWIWYEPTQLCLCVASDLTSIGFLSENSQFAQLLHDSGIVFAGPDPETITEFGLKHRARELAMKAGVSLGLAFIGASKF